MCRLLKVLIILSLLERIAEASFGLTKEDIKCTMPNGYILNPGVYIPNYQEMDQRVTKCIKCICMDGLVKCSFTDPECSIAPPTLENVKLNSMGLPMKESSLISTTGSKIPATSTTPKPSSTRSTSMYPVTQSTTPERRLMRPGSWWLTRPPFVNTDDPNEKDDFTEFYDNALTKSKIANTKRLYEQDESTTTTTTSPDDTQPSDEAVTESTSNATDETDAEVTSASETETETQTETDTPTTTTRRLLFKTTSTTTQPPPVTTTKTTRFLKTFKTPMTISTATSTTTEFPTTHPKTTSTATPMNTESDQQQQQQQLIFSDEEQIKLKNLLVKLNSLDHLSYYSIEPKVAYSHEYDVHSNKMTGEIGNLILLSLIAGCVLMVTTVACVYYVYGFVQIKKNKKLASTSTNINSTFPKSLLKTGSNLEYYV